MTESRARILNLAVKTERETISLKKEKGQLLDADEVRETTFNLFRSVRDAGMTLPEKISDQLAVMDNAFEIRLLLRKEIMAIFQSEVDKMNDS